MIKLLDCTLRDGGYVNNWEFGEETIAAIATELEKSNVDIVELGFLKDEEYFHDRTVFNNIEQISEYIPKKRNGIEYAAMIDAMNPIALDSITQHTDDTADIIRVMVWKSKHLENGDVVDCLQDGFEYCKKVVEKGYKLCLQPARVDQYSDEEFIAMIKLFESLEPLAIYIVDSWGTLLSEQVIHYAKIADRELNQNIALGFHGHNNMMQVMGTAVDFVNIKTNRDLFVDASVYGIGRCAGNLNIETFAEYLNNSKNKHYDISAMLSIYSKYIKEIRDRNNWGYSIPYFITGKYNCHPNYANYLCFEKGIDIELFERIVKSLEGDDKILFCKTLADSYLLKASSSEH